MVARAFRRRRARPREEHRGVGSLRAQRRGRHSRLQSLRPRGAAALAADGRPARVPDRAPAVPDRRGAERGAARAGAALGRDRRDTRLQVGAARSPAAQGAGAHRRRQCHRRDLSPLRRARQSAADGAGVRLGAAGSRRANPPAHDGDGAHDARRSRHGGRDTQGTFGADTRDHRGGSADGTLRGHARRLASAGAGPRRDDRHGAAAAHAPRRRGGQRPLRAADPARQSRLRRRASRVDQRARHGDAGSSEHAAGAQPRAPAGRALARGRPPACDPRLGRHRREHARRASRHRSALVPRQCHPRHHVERRVRALSGRRKGHQRARDAWPVSLRRSVGARARVASPIRRPTGASGPDGFRRHASVAETAAGGSR